MLIPLGILASSGGGAAGSFELISTNILSSTATSVTFDVSTLASTYKHLQIRQVVRGDRAASDGDAYFLRFNGDTGTNYTFHRLSGNGSTVSSGAGTGENRAYVADIPAATATASAFSPIVTDILDPFSTTKNTTIRTLSGRLTAEVAMRSALWINTAAITSINLFALNGNLIAGSRFSIYGIRGA